jgi:hypothetical protein
MASTAQYTAAPTLEVTTYSTSDTSLTAPTNFVQICAGPSATAANGVGKRIIRVTVTPAATIAASTIRFWISTDTGTNKYLIAEKLIAATTIAAGTTATPRLEVAELVGLILPGGNTVRVYASQSVATAINYMVEAGTL